MIGGVISGPKGRGGWCLKFLAGLNRSGGGGQVMYPSHYRGTLSLEKVLLLYFLPSCLCLTLLPESILHLRNGFNIICWDHLTSLRGILLSIHSSFSNRLQLFFSSLPEFEKSEVSHTRDGNKLLYFPRITLFCSKGILTGLTNNGGER